MRPRYHPANIGSRINDAISADHRARIDDRIATDLGPVADDRAKFRQSGRNCPVGGGDGNFAMIEFYIR